MPPAVTLNPPASAVKAVPPASVNSVPPKAIPVPAE